MGNQNSVPKEKIAITGIVRQANVCNRGSIYVADILQASKATFKISIIKLLQELDLLPGFGEIFIMLFTDY